LQGQRICSAKVVGTTVEENGVFCDRFLHNVNRYSWIFEQIFLPALTLMLSCCVFSKQNYRGPRQWHPHESNSFGRLKISIQGKFGMTFSLAD